LEPSGIYIIPIRLAGSGVRRIALSGDSAGGNLALGLSSRLTGEAVDFLK
jgi:acetyl esterase/lipase